MNISASLLPEDAKRPVREGVSRLARLAATEAIADDKGKSKAAEPTASSVPIPAEPPKRRGPGRPRKHPLPASKPEPLDDVLGFKPPKVKRGVGRPRKVVKPVVTAEPEVVRIGW